MTSDDARLQFLHREFAALSMLAAFATRDRLQPNYSAQATADDRKKFQEWIRHELRQLASTYESTNVSGDTHVQNIAALVERASQSFGSVLHKRRFRFGVAQKLLNLYLKYLWLARLVEEPPHCPIDGRIRDEAGLTYQWISSTSVHEYMDAIAVLKHRYEGQTLAAWELQAFESRRQ